MIQIKGRQLLDRLFIICCQGLNIQVEENAQELVQRYKFIIDISNLKNVDITQNKNETLAMAVDLQTQGFNQIV